MKRLGKIHGQTKPTMRNTISHASLAEPDAESTRRTYSLRHEYTVFMALAIFFALLGMALAVYATTSGPGVGGDATIYLTTAKNFASGNGLGWVEADGSYRLLPYAPPFYPLSLAFLSLLTDNLTAASRWFNIVLFGATSLLVGWSVTRATRQPWLGGLVSGLVAVSPVLLGVHLWTMSEPLFLLLGSGSLYLLWVYLDHPRRSVLIAAALLAGLAFLTRHIGLAFVLTGGLALLWTHQDAARTGLTRFLRWPGMREALLYGLIAVGPMLAWLAVDFFSTGTVGSRSTQPPAVYWQRLLEMGPALQSIYLFWLLPDSVSARLPGLVQAALWFIPLLALAVIGWLLVRTRTKEPTPNSQGADRLAALYGVYTLLYLLVLAGVHVFTYPPVTLASRMLSPVNLAALVLLALFAWQARARLLPSSRLALILVSLAGLALLGSYALRSTMIAREYHNTGIGYNAREWRNSATVYEMVRLPRYVTIITNEVTAVMYFDNRPAYALQEIYQDQPSPVFTVYGAGEDKAQLAFRNRGGALVLFYNTLHDDFAIYGDQVDERLAELTRGLYPYYEGEDGAIYFKTQPDFSESVCDACRIERYR
jgi:hypothetical protein